MTEKPLLEHCLIPAHQQLSQQIRKKLLSCLHSSLRHFINVYPQNVFFLAKWIYNLNFPAHETKLQLSH